MEQLLGKCQYSIWESQKKVILAASIPFFQNLLKRKSHPYPLVYERNKVWKPLSGLLEHLFEHLFEHFSEHFFEHLFQLDNFLEHLFEQDNFFEHFFEPSFDWPTHLSDLLSWVIPSIELFFEHSFELPPLLSTFLSDSLVWVLFWALFWAEQLFWAHFWALKKVGLLSKALFWVGLLFWVLFWALFWALKLTQNLYEHSIKAMKIDYLPWDNLGSFFTGPTQKVPCVWGWQNPYKERKS